MTPIGWLRWYWYLFRQRRAVRKRFKAFKASRKAR